MTLFLAVLHHVLKPLGFECYISDTAQQQPLRVKQVNQLSQAHRLPSVGPNAEVQTKLRTANCLLSTSRKGKQ